MTTSTVFVFGFKTIGSAENDWIHSPSKAARPTIEQLGGVVLEGTGEEVDVSALDAQGFYRRMATGWGALD